MVDWQRVISAIGEAVCNSDETANKEQSTKKQQQQKKLEIEGFLFLCCTFMDSRFGMSHLPVACVSLGPDYTDSMNTTTL